VSAPPSADLERLVRLGAAAHNAYRRANGSPHRAEIVGMGADGSPTEEIDRAAEVEVVRALDRERVDWNVLSEEAGFVDRGGRRTLVLDPIDGSHNALRGLPGATVSIALGDGTLSGIDIGLVHDLATGVVYWAERGKGAFRNGRPIRTRPWEERGELLFLNLGRHATPRTLRVAERARRVRSLGCASLEMVFVAQGSGDAYLFENREEARNLRVTDIAAGYRIVAEAGGGVANALGEPLADFPLTLGKHTSVLAWGDRRFRDRFVAEAAP
jgi:fructose-1,6-bisphosphatase/inositol monophosphatase family enzyme